LLAQLSSPAHADLTFRCRFEDWLDLTAGLTKPWRALLTRKVRPSGKLRLLLRPEAVRVAVR
jgi:putative sterol carrier protein